MQYQTAKAMDHIQLMEAFQRNATRLKRRAKRHGIKALIAKPSLNTDKLRNQLRVLQRL